MVDVLAFGAHPDDVELSIGGTLLTLVKMGYQVAMIDLTRGELSTNGTLKKRDEEARRAASKLQAIRENLELPDGGISDTPFFRRKVINVLRKYRPPLVLYPGPKDYHPDHEQANQLISSALYFSGVGSYSRGEAFRPQASLCFFHTLIQNPDLVVDVTEVYEEKLTLILTYGSQFIRQEGESSPTAINHPAFLQKIRTRDQYFGSLVGTLFGEGFTHQGPLKIHDLVKFFSKEVSS